MKKWGKMMKKGRCEGKKGKDDEVRHHGGKINDDPNLRLLRGHEPHCKKRINASRSASTQASSIKR